MATKQKFGGPWTVEKLNILSDYLDFYVQALKNQPFNLIYIDAFAGTGKIKIGDEDDFVEIDGSAKLALDSKISFDKYYFIEKKKSFAKELNQLITDEYSDKKSIIEVINDDCNNALRKLCDSIDWSQNRAVLFLDPYATAVNWETLRIIASTKSIDVWYLFPYSAANRMLKINGEIDESWKAKLISIFGSNDWENELYNEDPQINLFGDSHVVKSNQKEALKNYIEKRLNAIFPYVSKKSRILCNKNNSPLFLFCFAVSNDSPKAWGLAAKVANHIFDHD